MPKKIFAVTNIKIGSGADEYFPAGSVIDRTKFDNDTLLKLHEEGAVEIRVVDEDVAPDGTAIDEVNKDENPLVVNAVVETPASEKSEVKPEPEANKTEPAVDTKDSKPKDK